MIAHLRSGPVNFKGIMGTILLIACFLLSLLTPFLSSSSISTVTGNGGNKKISIITAEEETTNRTLGKISFVTYWNVPTFQCSSYNINFTGLAKKYNIQQNQYDDFRGGTIAILYDPGAFPAILKGSRSSRIVLRNGGVPQQGNLTLHLQLFKNKLEELIPNEDFSGVGIIDFESWRPIFRQNSGTLAPYKELSIDIEKQLHPFWPNFLIEKQAQKRFEIYAQIFMEETLAYAKILRPKATWGYYAYPYCFNMTPNNMKTPCVPEAIKENDRIEWLFNTTDNLHPSLYVRQHLTPKERMQLIIGRIQESHRIVGFLNKPIGPFIIPYYWFKYQDTNQFLTKEDIFNSVHTLRKLSIDGMILWGSSNDVNTATKCKELYNYIDTIFGPAIASL